MRFALYHLQTNFQTVKSKMLWFIGLGHHNLLKLESLSSFKINLLRFETNQRILCSLVALQYEEVWVCFVTAAPKRRTFSIGLTLTNNETMIEDEDEQVRLAIELSLQEQIRSSSTKDRVRKRSRKAPLLPTSSSTWMLAFTNKQKTWNLSC